VANDHPAGKPPTIGIEEEYLLVDARTGDPVPAAPRIRRLARGLPALDPDEVEPEMLQVQVEVATPACLELDEAAGHLLRLRSELLAAAQRAGVGLVSVGTAPKIGDRLPPVTGGERYPAIHAKAPRLVDEMLLNGLHVHVEIPTPDEGVRVLNHVRAWLPVLTALAANSPYWDGDDSGFASWRTVHFARWPVAGPPPAFVDGADYERRVVALLGTGSVIDRGQLYWQARLSHRYPTVEIRVCDAQLGVPDSVVLAGLLRGLVVTALATRDQPPLPPDELLRAAVWQAARDELTEHLVDPVERITRPAVDEVERLLDHVRPALSAVGDLDQVSALLDQRVREGPGARRQRDAAAKAGVAGVLSLLTEEFLTG
jgi:carboxylate-amine ligase